MTTFLKLLIFKTAVHYSLNPIETDTNRAGNSLKPSLTLQNRKNDLKVQFHLLHLPHPRIMPKQLVTRRSVDYAKDWLDPSFLFPGLEKGFTYGCDYWGAASNYFPEY